MPRGVGRWCPGMKATNAIIGQRVEEIHAIRLDGAQFVDIRQYAAEKCAAGEPPWAEEKDSPPPSERTLWRYLARTDQLIAQSCQEGRRKLFRRHLAQRRNLYAKALSQGDVRAALSCLRDEAELQRLYDLPPGDAPAAPPCATPADAVKLLAGTVEQLRRGQMDAKT